MPALTTPRSTADESRLQTQAGRVGLFFALTFATAWTLWIAAALVVPAESMGAGARALIFLPGTFAPAIVALALTGRVDGVAGVRALLSRLLRWDVGARWYVFAVAYLATIKLLAAVAHRVLMGGWPAFGTSPVLLMLAAVVLSTPFQAGEEIGWRGYALPRLATRVGLARASLIIGVVWAVWHIPLFYIAGTDTTGQPFPVFMLSVTAVSTAMAWLYVRTGASLLLVMLMHSAINNTTGIVPGRVLDPGNPMVLSATPVAWLTAALLSAAAAYFLLRMRGLRVTP
jgi:membrane protease YdiL (CAAX protease family)